MSFRQDLRALLEAGAGVTFGVNLFETLKATLPADGSVDGYLTVVRTGGSGPVFIHNSERPAWRMPGAAITAYAKRSSTAENLATLACDSVTVRNRPINDAFYLRIRPLQEPFEMPIGADGLARWRFNVIAERRLVTGANVSLYQLLADFGGDDDMIVTAASSDAYPSGSTFDKLVPGSSTVLLDPSRLPPGQVTLEASAKVDSAGARVKAAVFNLTDAPNTPIVEITFTTSELNGERLRSTPFTLPVGSKVYGVKFTVNSTTIGGAVWAARLLRV